MRSTRSPWSRRSPILSASTSAPSLDAPTLAAALRMLARVRLPSDAAVSKTARSCSVYSLGWRDIDRHPPCRGRALQVPHEGQRPVALRGLELVPSAPADDLLDEHAAGCRASLLSLVSPAPQQVGLVDDLLSPRPEGVG